MNSRVTNRLPAKYVVAAIFVAFAFGSAAYVSVRVVMNFYDWCCNNPFDDQKFDGSTWKAEHALQSSNSVRGRMIDDLRANHLRLGMTQAEVLELLGPTDAESEYAQLSYLVGMYSGMRMDFDTLDLHFDGATKSNRLVKIVIVQH